MQKHHDNYLANQIIAESYNLAKDKCDALQSNANVYGMQANYSRALGMYSEALNVCSGNEREIIRAKMAALSDQRAFDEEITSEGR